MKNVNNIRFMKKLYFTIITVLLISYSATGQYGTRQAGLRLGYRGGIFYQVTQEAGTAEMGYNALLSFNNNGLQITGLKVVYETTINSISDNLYFAWGYGGHATYFKR